MFYKVTKENGVNGNELIRKWVTHYVETHEENKAAAALHKEADQMTK